MNSIFLVFSMVGFIEVLPVEYTRELQVAKVAVVEISDARDCEAVLKKVNRLYPCDDQFGHLKRIKSQLGVIVILLGSAENHYEVNGPIKFVDVPKFAPYTKEQFKRWSELWPVAYKRPSLEPIHSVAPTHLMLVSQLGADECLIVAPDGRRFSSTGQKTLLASHPLGHASMRGIAAVAQGEPAEEDYLCSGFDVYVRREPCVMCGMALLHSRVAAVYYLEPRLHFGAFQNRLHCNPRLNHRFKAIRLLVSS